MLKIGGLEVEANRRTGIACEEGSSKRDRRNVRITLPQTKQKGFLFGASKVHDVLSSRPFIPLVPRVDFPSGRSRPVRASGK